LQVVLFEYFFRGGAVIEVVIDLRTLYPVAFVVREVEVVRARAGVIFAVAGGGDQERHFSADAPAAQVETRIRTRSEAVESSARRRFALPHHAAGFGTRFAEVEHQRRAIQPPHTHFHSLPFDGDLNQPRAQAHRAAGIPGGHDDGFVRRLRAGMQRTVEHPAEMKRARRDPDQLGVAAVELQLDPVAVRQNGQQCRHCGQRLRGHYSRTISRCISPVTRASLSPMNMLISLRTPKFAR
jgi:hypothetical protein